jgi:hypothetical protein
MTKELAMGHYIVFKNFNEMDRCVNFDIYIRCMFALEHVKGEFNLIKGKL